MLCLQDAVHGIKRQLSPATQEIGEMSLGETGLAREERDAERSALDPAEQFHTESIVHLGEVHRWIIR